ncbi:MAG: N-acetylglucosamine-6-phosphate deacetylase [Myxococcota bacterium]
MPACVLTRATLVDPEGAAPERGSLLIEGGRIAAILSEADPLPDAPCHDLRGQRLAPGFIDLHYHGGLVLQEATGWRESLRASSESLVRHGTTGFLATTVAWSREVLAERVGALAELLAREQWPGAVPIGLHLEGPWIRPEAAGAQPSAAIRAYDPAEGREVLERGDGSVRLVTLAPEVEGAPALLGDLARRGVVAALGHSRAAPPDIESGIAEGLVHVTHLFNAMGSFHHRDVGTAGFALADDRLSCDLICDGAHVHPAAVRTAARAKGEGLVLITDRVEIDPPGPAGTAAPSFGSGELHSDGTALRLPDGRLAASHLTLDRAVANFREFTGATLPEAVAACTLRPARLLGIESERGTLRVGARADLVVIGDDGSICQTWIGGNLTHK